jgi:hypothetical protein
MLVDTVRVLGGVVERDKICPRNMIAAYCFIFSLIPESPYVLMTRHSVTLDRARVKLG